MKSEVQQWLVGCLKRSIIIQELRGRVVFEGRDKMVLEMYAVEHFLVGSGWSGSKCDIRMGQLVLLVG